MLAKLVANAVVVGGKDVHTLLEHGFGSKFLPASIKPSNDVNISQLSIDADGEPLMTISLSKSSEDAVDGMKKDDENDVDDDSQQVDRLILRDEEAYYIASKGALTVINAHNQPMTSSELWYIFITKNASFPALYKTYEFFKIKGYVVKGGINYGVEFTVYKTTPLWCHSEICALVIDSRHSSSAMDEDDDHHSLAWNQICAQTRITQDVMKTLMICYIIIKSDISTDIAINWSLESSLDSLDVRPVIVINRRHNIMNDKYMTATELQAKNAGLSILKRSRALIQAKKIKQMKKKPMTEPLKKKKSKHNKVWTSLLKPATSNINNKDNSNNKHTSSSSSRG